MSRGTVNRATPAPFPLGLLLAASLWLGACWAVATATAGAPSDPPPQPLTEEVTP